MWYDWRDPSRPCFFGPAETARHRTILESLAPQSLRRPAPANKRVHLFRQHWNNNAAGSFLALNTLAADLSLLQDKPGVGIVLRDLWLDQHYASALHTLHCAAMFERSRPGAVREFIDAKNSSVPDFVVSIGTADIPVECKSLAGSDAERSFSARAVPLMHAIGRTLDALSLNVRAVIAVRPGGHRRVAEEVARLLEAHQEQLARQPALIRHPLVNIECRPQPPNSKFYELRTVGIVTPIDPSEDYRAVDRAKKASKQLRAYGGRNGSGVLMLGLTDRQSGILVRRHIEDKCRGGDLSGIAAIALVKAGHETSQQYSPADLVEPFVNPRAAIPLVESPMLTPISGVRVMSIVEPHIRGVPVYWVGGSSGRIRSVSDSGALSLPDLSLVSSELLRWIDDPRK